MIKILVDKKDEEVNQPMIVRSDNSVAVHTTNHDGDDDDDHDSDKENKNLFCQAMMKGLENFLLAMKKTKEKQNCHSTPNLKRRSQKNFFSTKKTIDSKKKKMVKKQSSKQIANKKQKKQVKSSNNDNNNDLKRLELLMKKFKK